jgi:hypothetical protein
VVLTVDTQIAPFGSHSRRIDTSGACTPIGGYFAFMILAVIRVGGWRSAKAVGERVPERDLVRGQRQGRPHRLLRIFTCGKPGGDHGRRLLGKARGWLGFVRNPGANTSRSVLVNTARLGHGR